MAHWKYILKNGTALREAIDNEDMEQVVKCLLFCCAELDRKLSDEDRITYGLDLDDIYVGLTCFDINEDEEENEETINYYLGQFYDICDDVRAWIEV